MLSSGNYCSITLVLRSCNLIVAAHYVDDVCLCGKEGRPSLRGDQIEVFKILNGYENIDSNIFSKLRK